MAEVSVEAFVAERRHSWRRPPVWPDGGCVLRRRVVRSRLVPKCPMVIGGVTKPESTDAVRLLGLARPPERPPDVGECCLK